MTAHDQGRALGWFSLALGATEVIFPGRIAGWLGVPQHATTVRAFGVREIAAGAGLLTQRRLAPWMWARVAGDALDAAALVAALRTPGARRGPIAASLAFVGGALALDALVAESLS